MLKLANRISRCRRQHKFLDGAAFTGDVAPAQPCLANFCKERIHG